ncbi:hypothetical protein HD554DRAFT_2177811 [Boletus coccyginus]|nr:hypothetical protein HD554DRAFT_2177811 [Boletus coccyginus]
MVRRIPSKNYHSHRKRTSPLSLQEPSRRRWLEPIVDITSSLFAMALFALAFDMAVFGLRKLESYFIG